MNSCILATRAFLVLSLLSATAALADTQVRISSFEYDAAGILAKEVVEPDRPNDCLQTSYSYDSFGNRSGASASACAGAAGDTLSSAATARTTSTSFGTDGRFAVGSTNALGQAETRTYDARFGVVSSVTGPNGLTTAWEYDGFGRKKREVRADGTLTGWSYLRCVDAGANCPGPIGGAHSAWVAVTQDYGSNGVASGPERRQFHDAFDRVLRVQAQGFEPGMVVVQDTEYNALGQVARKSNAYQLGTAATWSEYSYDSLGRVVQERTPDPAVASGGVAVTSHSYNGLVVTVTNSKGQTRTTTRNAHGQPAQVSDSEGQLLLYTYDALGQLVRTEANGAVTTLAYNRRGQKTGMADLSMGAWEYRYNAFGELVWQRDSLGQVATIAYDLLGRMIQRNEPDLVSQWSYDKKFDNSACGKGVGKLCEATANNGYRRLHAYDTLGRPSSTSTVMDNPAAPAVVSVGYEAMTGRVASKTWPTGYQAAYEYTALGFLKKVTGSGAGSTALTYEVLNMDAQGHITRYRQGAKITTVRSFETATGRLQGQLATVDGQASGGLLNQAYTYDSLSNLTSRTDNTPGVGTSENFSYDALNRLNQYTFVGGGVSPPRTTQVLYDARGNIAYKSDVGRYWYDPQRPDRLNSVTLETAPGGVPLAGTRALSYAYNDDRPQAQLVAGVKTSNGNLEYTVSLDQVNNRHTYRGETYTSFNMPLEINFGNFINGAATTADRVLSFVYGPEHQRIKQQVQLTSGAPTAYSAGTTWYLNGQDSLGLSYEKDVKDSGLVEHKHYLGAGGVVFGMYVSRSGTLNGAAAASHRYFLHDHLGSVAVVADELGQVVERLAYDPWGKRRNVNGINDVTDSLVGQATDRGFTMHEHLDEIGVIHMNGRIYDPLAGRFMSADPFIASPDNLQNHNRYAYVSNNPLNATDPSGYFSWNPFKHNPLDVIEVVRKVDQAHLKLTFKAFAAQPGQKWVDNYVMTHKWAYAAGQYAATAFTAICGGCGGAIWSAYYTYRATGSISAAQRAGAITYATTYAFSYVNAGGGAPTPGTVLANGVIGGVSSRLQGGDFEDGFRSSFITSALTYVNAVMRAEMVAQSRINPDNASGQSAGFFNDLFKLAGARREYDPVSERYVTCFSLMGGCQGAPRPGAGEAGSSFFGKAYQAGSWMDRINESFAGPHDWFRNMTGSYDAAGNSHHFTGFRLGVDTVMNYGLVVPAAGPGVAALISPSGYGALGAPSPRQRREDL